jgi:hypothetical protein
MKNQKVFHDQESSKTVYRINQSLIALCILLSGSFLLSFLILGFSFGFPFFFLVSPIQLGPLILGFSVAWFSCLFFSFLGFIACFCVSDLSIGFSLYKILSLSGD